MRCATLTRCVVAAAVLDTAAAMAGVVPGRYDGTLSCGPLLNGSSGMGWSTPVVLELDGTSAYWRRAGTDRQDGSEYLETADARWAADGKLYVEASGSYLPGSARKGAWLTEGMLQLDGSRLTGAMGQSDPARRQIFRNCRFEAQVKIVPPVALAATTPDAPHVPLTATVAAPASATDATRVPESVVEGAAAAPASAVEAVGTAPLTAAAAEAVQAGPAAATVPDAGVSIQTEDAAGAKPAAHTAPPPPVHSVSEPSPGVAESGFSSFLEHVMHSQAAQALGLALLAAAAGWVWHAFLRNRCPSCRSTGPDLLEVNETDRWRGTKQVTERHSKGTNTRHVQTTYVKMAYHFECTACSEKWVRERKEELGANMLLQRLISGY